MMHCLFVCCAILWPIFAGFSCCCCCLNLKFYYAVSDLEHWPVLAHQYPLADSTDSRRALLQAMKDGNAPQPIGKQPIKNLTQKWHSPRQRWWLPNLWRWFQNYFMRKDILINRGISGISCSWSEMFRHPDSDLDIRHFHWNFTEQLVFCCYTIFVFSTTGTMIFFSKCLVSFPSSGPLHEPSNWQDRMPADAAAGHCWGLCITTLFVYFRISDTHIHAH